ncbi:MAG: hypothetical protein ACR2LT_01565 [Pyrinomonadaceae bacterium]
MINFIKRAPLTCALLLVFCGIISGAIFGWIYAAYKIEIIAAQVKQAQPDDPLDGLWIVSLGIIFKGLIIGTLVGIFSGVVIFLFGKNKNKESALR